MGKPEQFLWIVQTLMIQNAINLASNSKWADKYRVEIAASGAYILCDEAVRASERIPDNMSAAEAAHDFYFFMASNHREQEEEATGKRMQVPAWFARYGGSPDGVA